MKIVLDALGQSLAVGDLVAYAVSRGSSGEMRVGRITEFLPLKDYDGTPCDDKPPRFRVDLVVAGPWSAGRPTLLEFGERALKLPADFPVPQSCDNPLHEKPWLQSRWRNPCADCAGTGWLPVVLNAH